MSRRHLAVQAAVLDRLGDMLLPDRIAPIQVSDGAGHFEDAAVGAGRKAEPISDQLQHPTAGRVRLTELLYETGCHLGVAVNFGAPETIPLDLPGTLHATADGPGAFTLAAVGQIAVLDGGNLDVDIDPVQKRPGDAGPVALDHDRRAGAGVEGISQIAAGAGVHGRHEHEARRIGKGHERAGDGDATVLQRLAENLQDMFLELR